MKTIPSQDCNPFAHRNPTGTSSSTTSASGGQSTQAARPLVTPLRPTSQKIRRRRDDPRNRNLPRRTTTSAARDITIPGQSTSDQLIMNNANNLDNPLYLDETHFPALAVYHPAQVQQTPQRPRCRWAREPNFYIRSIPHTFCRHFECLTTAEFVSNYPNATITQERVLLSILYTASFIWEETVEEMGFTIDTGDPPPVSMDPRTGQVLEPIGWLPLYVKLHGPEHDSMQLVWFGVLAGSPAEVGVRCIIGEPDLRKIYGSALDIERYNRERGA